MTKTIICPLVGGHFRPPAKQLIAASPTGLPLAIQPEPENPYDEDAVKVMLDPQDIPVSQHESLEETLPLAGYDLYQVLSGGPVQVGYIAKSGGKPLVKLNEAHGGIYRGNREALEALVEGGRIRSSLRFGPSGEPLVVITTEEA